MNIKTMENKVKVWLAREDSGILYLCMNKPKKTPNGWFCTGYVMNLGEHNFPQIKWKDDEPTEAYITLAESQEQPTPKQEIDWEQRRYEIAKEIMPLFCRQGMEAQKHGQSVKRKDTVYYAVIFADMLIQKLKEKSDEL